MYASTSHSADGQVLVKLGRWYKFDRLQSRFTQRSSVYSARRKPLTMFHLAGKTFLVLSFMSSFLGSTRSFAESRDVIEGLDLESYSEKQVKGCYHYNKTLSICFDIQQHSMRLLKTTGENIFVDQDLYPDSFFYQVLDQAFLGYEDNRFRLNCQKIFL